MSVADTLHDAVAELDEYIRTGAEWGEASTGAPWHAELLDVRERMQALRVKIDGAYAEAMSPRPESEPDLAGAPEPEPEPIGGEHAS